MALKPVYAESAIVNTSHESFCWPFKQCSRILILTRVCKGSIKITKKKCSAESDPIDSWMAISSKIGGIYLGNVEMVIANKSCGYRPFLFLLHQWSPLRAPHVSEIPGDARRKRVQPTSHLPDAAVCASVLLVTVSDSGRSRRSNYGRSFRLSRRVWTFSWRIGISGAKEGVKA